MWEIILSAIASLLEKVGWQWWTEHKIEEADNEQNKVSSMSDSNVLNGLRKWTKPPN